MRQLSDCCTAPATHELKERAIGFQLQCQWQILRQDMASACCLEFEIHRVPMVQEHAARPLPPGLVSDIVCQDRPFGRALRAAVAAVLPVGGLRWKNQEE